MKKLTKEMQVIVDKINHLLKENNMVKEYNDLYNFLNECEDFKDATNKLLNDKKQLRTNENYNENCDRFLTNKKRLDNNYAYQNYLSIKEELNNLFNELVNILSIK